MEADPRLLKFFARYDLAAKHWSPSTVFDYRTVRRIFAPKISPDDLLDALNTLYALTELRCFRDAADVLLERGIILETSWNTDALTPGVENLESRVECNAVAMVQLFADMGMSRRLAMANAAANLRWPGNSFAAAVKSIERLCQDTSRQKDRTTSAGKCPKTKSA